MLGSGMRVGSIGLLVLMPMLALEPGWRVASGQETATAGADAGAADVLSPASIRAEAQSRFKADQQRYRGREDVLVLPGLVADRKAREVRVWARATGLKAGEAVEFWLIPADSGKDYEALAVSLAKPSDIHQAMEFLGLRPGLPVNRNAARLWPSGERVLVSFRWGEDQEARAEELITDTRTGQPLPLTGLVFVGSFTAEQENAEGKKERVYAADVAPPRSIASVYNEPTTVFDVPMQWFQGDVYSFLQASAQPGLTRGTELTVSIRPERKADDPPRILGLRLDVRPPANFTAAGTARDLLLSVQTLGVDERQATAARDAGWTPKDADLATLLGAMVKITQAQRDPFVKVQMDPSLPIGMVRQVYAVLRAVEGPSGLRLDAPLQGELSPEAFFPDEMWRDRKMRVRTPMELHFAADAPPTLIDVTEDWEAPQPPVFVEKKHAVPKPGDLAGLVRQIDPEGRRALFVFAPASLTYGSLREYLGPVTASNSWVYVFLPPKQAPPAAAP